MSVWTSKLLSVLKNGVENRGDEDWVVEFGIAAFGATADSVELELPRLETVEAAHFDWIGAAGTVADGPPNAADQTLTSGALTVVRKAHADGARSFSYIVIGKPVET